MTPVEIIQRKRDGRELSKEEIEYFISSFMRNEIKDYQMTAFLMAVYFRGMSYEETTHLTRAYIHSGDVIDLKDIPGIKVDKHSTGGVGDKVSIVLAPLVASLGVPVPMISGRGLGHTGGTLDKLESIPGFRTNLSIEEFRELLKKYTLAMIGQTENIVPADKRIYALRDVTATINNISLITASIMSKKIAEGIDALVLDVKYGNGAFMQKQEEAEELAKNLIKTGKQFDKKVIAAITSMEQPLGYKIGNWLEVEECLDCFSGNGPEDLMELVFELSANMLILGGKAANKQDARRMCRDAIQNGRAFDKFLQLTRAQGGDTTILQNPGKYPLASYRKTFDAAKSGFITAMPALEIGMASVELGAGRLRAEDSVDAQAGIILFKKIGDRVKPGDAILEMRTNNSNALKTVEKRIRHAIRVEETPPETNPLILKEII